LYRGEFYCGSYEKTISINHKIHHVLQFEVYRFASGSSVLWLSENQEAMEAVVSYWKRKRSQQKLQLSFPSCLDLIFAQNYLSKN